MASDTTMYIHIGAWSKAAVLVSRFFSHVYSVTFVGQTLGEVRCPCRTLGTRCHHVQSESHGQPARRSTFCSWSSHCATGAPQRKYTCCLQVLKKEKPKLDNKSNKHIKKDYFFEYTICLMFCSAKECMWLPLMGVVQEAHFLA